MRLPINFCKLFLRRGGIKKDNFHETILKTILLRFFHLSEMKVDHKVATDFCWFVLGDMVATLEGGGYRLLSGEGNDYFELVLAGVEFDEITVGAQFPAKIVSS